MEQMGPTADRWVDSLEGAGVAPHDLGHLGPQHDGILIAADNGAAFNHSSART